MEAAICSKVDLCVTLGVWVWLGRMGGGREEICCLLSGRGSRSGEGEEGGEGVKGSLKSRGVGPWERMGFRVKLERLSGGGRGRGKGEEAAVCHLRLGCGHVGTVD